MTDNNTPETVPENDKSKTPVAAAVGKTGTRVCVFCSANDLEEKYTKPAEEFARLIGEHGHEFVWGGSDSGLMKQMATAAQGAGARIVGISVEYLKHAARKGADEMIIAKDLGERKAQMLERSDVVVMMVGGLGTLDEATEVIEHKKHGHHNKPIVIFNTDGFYDGLHQQLSRMEKDGFLPNSLDDYVQFANTPAEAIDIVDAVSAQTSP